MFLRTYQFLLRKTGHTKSKYVSIIPSCSLNCRLCSQYSSDKRVFDLFFQENVQDLLKKLTRPNFEKIFRKRKDEKPLQPPKYKFMTTEELEQVKKEAEERGLKRLLMPPVLPAKEDDNSILSNDKAIKGYCNSKFVFTDISFANNDRTRSIVVREPDGTLRKAKIEERSRMNELYFPRPGRKYKTPEVFKQPYLQAALDRGEFEFVLERACAQFEPDDPAFVQVVEETYRAVDSSASYFALRSTRHFGPLVFYLVRTRSVDNLLLENLKTDRLEDAVWLISLYHIVHPEAKSAKFTYEKGKELEFIKAFIDHDSKQRDTLSLEFAACKDFLSCPKSEKLEVQQ